MSNKEKAFEILRKEGILDIIENLVFQNGLSLVSNRLWLDPGFVPERRKKDFLYDDESPKIEQIYDFISTDVSCNPSKEVHIRYKKDYFVFLVLFSFDNAHEKPDITYKEILVYFNDRQLLKTTHHPVEDYMEHILKLDYDSVDKVWREPLHKTTSIHLSSKWISSLKKLSSDINYLKKELDVFDKVKSAKEEKKREGSVSFGDYKK